VHEDLLVSCAYTHRCAPIPRDPHRVAGRLAASRFPPRL